MPSGSDVARVVDALGAMDAPVCQIAGEQGRLVVTEHAARIVACEIQGVSGNLFWHHKDMETVDGARACMSAAGGDIGGDRLWLAPEVGYIWPDLAAARIDPKNTAELPPAMDPGSWHADQTSTRHVTLCQSCDLTDHRTGKRIVCDIKREIFAIDPPAGTDAQLKTLSFALRHTLTAREGDTGAAAGCWSLLQVPPGDPFGELICPTVAPLTDEPRSYYDPYEGRVISDQAAVRFPIDARHRMKMGLPAENVTGRMGYVRKLSGEQASLIVRIFLPQPGGVFVDVPRSEDATVGGDAIQAYNDDRGPDFFGEMEYHDPAVVVGSGPGTQIGVSVTHVAVGPADVIRDACLRWVGAGSTILA